MLLLVDLPTADFQSCSRAETFDVAMTRCFNFLSAQRVFKARQVAFREHNQLFKGMTNVSVADIFQALDFQDGVAISVFSPCGLELVIGVSLSMFCVS